MSGAPGLSKVNSPPLEGQVLIPAGSFQMGDSFEDVDGSGGVYTYERPVHAVYISAFSMDRYEVTKALWDKVANWAAAHSYDISPGDGDGTATDHPVWNVSYEAVKWANARSEMEGLTPCYTTSGIVYRMGENAPDCNWSARGYRLPTEAEWEKAARGGAAGRRFPWSDGDTIQHGRANYHSSDGIFGYDTSPSRGLHPSVATGNSIPTSPVGSFAPNGYGLYDMAGNVEEWCWDWFGTRPTLPSPESEPRGPDSGSFRVLRGGCVGGSAFWCRVAARNKTMPSTARPLDGFRLVRTASSASASLTPQTASGTRETVVSSVVVVAIDPGHGGADTGSSSEGVLEKAVALAVARKMSALASDFPGLRILLVRSADTEMSAEDRAALALSEGVQLYVALHVNSFGQPTALGIETVVDSIHKPGDASCLC